jgi:proline dehydrogenase
VSAAPVRVGAVARLGAPAARARHAARRLAARAARRYVAGPELADALRAQQRLRDQGTATTLGYWGRAGEPVAAVEAVYDEAVIALAARPGAQLSIKPPAFAGDAARLEAFTRRALAAGVAVHADSLDPERAGDGLDLAARCAGAGVGATLPGRWVRSVQDAARLRDLDVPLRLVKGQWADPLQPRHDPAAGLLAVAHVLAGRSALVAVASHDGPLAGHALAVLRAAGTPCELQLLFGLPATASAAVARVHGVPLRAYVPYGAAYLPYALSALRRRPHVAGWLARDLLVGDPDWVRSLAGA